MKFLLTIMEVKSFHCNQEKFHHDKKYFHQDKETFSCLNESFIFSSFFVF